MEPEKKSNGAFVGLVVIIIILVVGGIYIWQQNRKALQKQPETTITTQDSAALDALDQDLQTTDTDVGVDVNAVN